jgi:UDP-glucose 4-epimerase
VGALVARLAGQPVLVTGGAGFIGSHLVAALCQAGARVTVLDNLQAGKWSNLEGAAGVETLEGDVRDAATVEALVARLMPTTVFHLAANASVPGSVQDPVYDYESNASGTFVVLNAVRLAGNGARVVAVSSGAVYGEPLTFPITESDLLAPISPYGASKLNAEVTARMFVRVYKTPVVIARIFNAYGPRMARFVVLDFLRKLKANPGNLEILGTGQQIRDFTYVLDTVQGLLTLALEGEAGESYNISSGTYCSVTQLAQQLIGVRGLTGQTTLSYTGSSWVGDAQRWEVAIDRLQGLGYAPQFDLAAGLQQTAAWFDEVEAS